jgi:hypothetical protein
LINILNVDQLELPVDYPQPYGHPIDLTQPEALLRQEIASMLAKLKAPKGDCK